MKKTNKTLNKVESVQTKSQKQKTIQKIKSNKQKTMHKPLLRKMSTVKRNIH